MGGSRQTCEETEDNCGEEGWWLGLGWSQWAAESRTVHCEEREEAGSVQATPRVALPFLKQDRWGRREPGAQGWPRCLQSRSGATRRPAGGRHASLEFSTEEMGIWGSSAQMVLKLWRRFGPQGGGYRLRCARGKPPVFAVKETERGSQRRGRQPREHVQEISPRGC